MTELPVQPVLFKFRLGEWTLFSLSRPMQAWTPTLLDAPEAAARPTPRADFVLAPDSQGFALHGMPVSAPQPALEKRGALLCYCPLQYTHCYIDLRGSFDAYQKKFSAKTRSTIQRKVRKFAELSAGTMHWRTFTQPHEMREFLQLAHEVSRHTYQEKLFDAGIPTSEAFACNAEQLAARNELRAYLLFHEGKPVSYLFCPVREGTLIYAYLGYRPDYRQYSVGTVLQWLALEQIFAEDCFRCFDFTEGQSDHKLLFSTHQRQCANVFFLRPGLRNLLLLRAHLLTDRLSAAIGGMLDRWGLKAKVRRLMRRS